jgi:Winged helix-turn-helix DNA-binding
MNNKKLVELLETGVSYKEISKQLGISKSTISYYAKRLDLMRGQSFDKIIYDWEAMQLYYDEGHCLLEVAQYFNIKYAAVLGGSGRGKLKTDPQRKCNKREYFYKIKNEDIFKENSPYKTCTARHRILSANLIPYYCNNDNCILYKVERPSWAGNPIVLHIDHINGINNDHRLSNLRWLCPNCHSQTDTYCARNIKNLRERRKIKD